jgi:hypothetical protein
MYDYAFQMIIDLLKDIRKELKELNKKLEDKEDE